MKLLTSGIALVLAVFSIPGWADTCLFLLEEEGEEGGLQWVAERAVRRFYTADLSLIVRQIASLGPIELNSPFRLSGKAMENGKTLEIHLDGIGPRAEEALPPASVKDQKAIRAGMSIFRGHVVPNPRMYKAVVAVLLGVKARLKINPSIEKVIFYAVDVLNWSLRYTLMEKMGMEIVGYRTIGGDSAVTLQREVLLKQLR
jgi:hypothetical protein